MAARIAICIDDFGLHPAVNEAILSLVANGRVTATSCMVGAPAWAHDAPRLKAAFDASLVDAGLHLDFTEHPIDAHLRGSVRSWMLRSLLHAVDGQRVRGEIRAQLDRFEAAMGRAPSHVDGHEHVFQFPVVRDLLVEELLRRYGRSQLPWLRRTRGAARAGTKGRVIEAMGAGPLERLAGEHGFAQNRSMWGVYDFRGGPRRFTALLQQWLGQAQDGDLLMCHVATAMVPGDGIAAARMNEYEVFRQPGFDDLVRDAGVSLVRMSAIARASGGETGHRGAY